MSSGMNIKAVGFGAWGADFTDWPGLQTLLKTGVSQQDGGRGPKPQIIPANERRRAPLPVRLAIESSWQAVQQSGLPAKDVASVFVSGLGDTQLTDYMCKVLAGENKQLSPTKFHNSVHNAAAGYWTISTQCMQAASAIAGMRESASLCLLEGIMQCTQEDRPVLLTFYDAPASPVLMKLFANQQPFAFSMVIVPENFSANGMRMKVDVLSEPSDWPELSVCDSLQHCYQHNPAARILALLAQFSGLVVSSGRGLTMPLSPASSLRLTA